MYTDGSGLYPTQSLLRSAGFAAVQIDPETGATVKSMAAAVPRAWEQTAAAAERLCVAVVWGRLKGDTCVASDCGGAVSAAADVAPITMARSAAPVAARNRMFCIKCPIRCLRPSTPIRPIRAELTYMYDAVKTTRDFAGRAPGWSSAPFRGIRRCVAATQTQS